METSLRLGSGGGAGETKSLRLHAKQKFPVDAKPLLLQAHADVDTHVGSLNFLALILRRFHPGLSASTGVGVHFNKHGEYKYILRAKKLFPITSNGLVSFKIKGKCDVDKEFREGKPGGAVEVVWSIFNLQRDQDLRIKLGYELSEKVPYLQLRENNWTLNTDINGRWNIFPATLHDVVRRTLVDDLQLYEGALKATAQVVTNSISYLSFGAD